MNSRRQHRMMWFIASVFLVLGLAGCASSAKPHQVMTLTNLEAATLAQQPAYLQPLFKKLFEEGRHNEVLNRMEIGTAAFYQGDLDLARESFDIALARIETVYAADEQAQQARSLWHEEGRKDFKGEPYERAMAYYYRGLIYLVDAEYDNARASFVTGLMQDAFAEEEQNRSDLAILMLLAGWSAQKMGSNSLAQEAYAELQALRPDFPIPAADDNVLVIAETGYSPRKLADGVGHYELVFRRGKQFNEKSVVFSADTAVPQVQPIEDVFWQASSRGGRPIDAIIEGKATFRQMNAEMGKTLGELGVAANVFAPLAEGNLGQAGNALALVGVAQMALSMNVKPRADTRYWSRLPDTLHATTYQELSGEASLTQDWQASYRDIDGQPLELSSGGFSEYLDKNGNRVIWHSSRPRI
jgi:tetratricopeptide (TPR) repeat protein